MAGNLNKLISCLKELDFKPNIGSFEDRLIIQKADYLLQLKGISMGFKYGFYIRGPYSPDLTQEVYKNKARLEQLKTNVVLTKEEKNKVDGLKNLIGIKSGILEIAATYAYLIKQGLDPLSALKSVKMHKPFFSETQIAVGISRVKEYLFPPSSDNIRSMQIEMKQWESASNKGYSQ